jgi:hypothetical protein
LYQAIIKADKKYIPVDVANENLVINIKTEEQIKRKWATKPIHGKHYRELNNKYVDKEPSNKWLDSCNLFRETEALMIAIQDGVLPTRNYQKHIIKKAEVKDECRKCGKEGETIEHIFSGCKIMAKEEYLLRHNNVAKVVHQELAHRIQLIKEKKPNFKHVPDNALESNRYKLTWDLSVITDKQIHANRPDVILIDHLNSPTYLIDIAVPNTHTHTQSHKLIQL